MSFAALKPVTRVIALNGGEITLRPLTVADLQYVWTRHGGEIREAFDTIMSDKLDAVDTTSVMNSAIAHLPGTIHDLILLSNDQDPDNQVERAAVEALPLGTLAKIAAVVYEVSMVDSDDLKKTLGGVFKQEQTLTKQMLKTMNIQ